MEIYEHYYTTGIIIITILLLFFLSFYTQKAKKVLILTALISNGVYLLWRSTSTLPTANIFYIIAGLLLLTTEWAGYFQQTIFYTLLWKPRKRKHVSLDWFETLPTVDIFIATYNEPIKILKRTVAACKKLNYPNELLTIYLCDDGNRDSVKMLADEFSIEYLSRENNLHAKAGNLNHAMEHSNGEYIVVLDADMIPKTEFLERTLGYFSNPKVGFVQTPQAFYNADPFQYNLFLEKQIPNEQDFFMHLIQSGKDRFNAVMFVGTNAVFRRKALEDIGGFATGVITEDMATGMLLQAKKYKSVFVNETLAEGLSAENWSDLLKQRDRWCRGNIQCAKKWNPLTIPGLTLMQRILYFDGILYWFFGVFKLIFTLAPLLFLLLHIYSLQTDFWSLMQFWSPAFLASTLAFRSVSNGTRSVFWSHIYEISMAPYLALSVISELLFNRRIEFHVTRKGITEDQRIFRFNVALPNIILFVLTIIAFVKSALLFINGNMVDNNSYFINIFWGLYNGIALFVSIIIAFDRPRYRKVERFSIKEKGQIKIPKQYLECFVLDINETGARIQVMKNDFQELNTMGSFELSLGNIHHIKSNKKWIKPMGNVVELGLEFTNLNTENYTNLIHLLFNNGHPIESLTYHSSPIGAIPGFFNKTEKRPIKMKRSFLRKPVNIEGEIFPSFNDLSHMRDSSKFYKELNKVKIIDYHEMGCQIITEVPLKTGDYIKITIPELNKHNVKALVRWSSKSKNNKIINAGLNFL